jgi:CBS domain-containing protein
LVGFSERFLQKTNSVMESAGQMTRELKQVLRELASARDEARVRAHLLSMDARRRLADVEQEIENFEHKLAARGDWVAEHVMATARGLTRAVAELASRPEPEQTRVRDLMSPSPITCRPADDLRLAAQRMWEGDFGVLPVVDEARKPVGILTDRDICMAAYTRGRALAELSVADAMSRGVRTCKPSHSLRSAMDLMVTHQVRRLPVVSDEGTLVGIVSLADIARFTQAPSSLSHEARVWMPGVLAGISERAGTKPWANSAS